MIENVLLCLRIFCFRRKFSLERYHRSIQIWFYHLNLSLRISSGNCRHRYMSCHHLISLGYLYFWNGLWVSSPSSHIFQFLCLYIPTLIKLMWWCVRWLLKSSYTCSRREPKIISLNHYLIPFFLNLTVWSRLHLSFVTPHWINWTKPIYLILI